VATFLAAILAFGFAVFVFEALAFVFFASCPP